MFQIIIIPNNSTANGALFFKTRESAEATHKHIHEAQKGTLPAQVLICKDDFGCTLTIDKENICYCVLMDGEKQQELQIMMSGGNAPPRAMPSSIIQ